MCNCWNTEVFINAEGILMLVPLCTLTVVPAFLIDEVTIAFLCSSGIGIMRSSNISSLAAWLQPMPLDCRFVFSSSVERCTNG